MKKIFFFFLSIALLASCSISKRKYLSGYHIDWNTRTKNIATVQSAKKSKPEIQKNISEKNIFESQKAITKKNNLSISTSKNEKVVPKNLSIGKVFFPKLMKPFSLFGDTLKSNQSPINSVRKKEVKNPWLSPLFGGLSLLSSILFLYSFVAGNIGAALLLLILTIILCFITIRKTSEIRHNSNGRYKGLAILAIILVCLSILLLVLIY
ncbi:MAG: lipoprotein [Bacteroidia bacterium]